MNRCRRATNRPTARVRGAFTLIELLVVISIIALLISILLPALGKATASARNALCLSNCHQMVIAQLAYATDNKQTLPAPMTDTDVNTEGLVYPWQATVYEYVTGSRLDDSQLVSGATHDYLDGSAFECPQATFNHDGGFWTITYAMNVDLPGISRQKNPEVFSFGDRMDVQFKLLDPIQTPSATFLLGDGSGVVISARNAGDKDQITAMGSEAGGGGFDTVTSVGGQFNRHDDNVNVALVDGSVRSRNWLSSEEDIPVPDRLGPMVPETFDREVQLFWFGRTSDLPTATQWRVGR